MAASWTIDTLLGVPDTTSREGFYQGVITLSGSYPPGGDTLSLSGYNVLSNTAPLRVEIYEEPASTQTATAYTFIYAKGTTNTNGKIQIFSAGGTQFSGSYSTTFSTTVIKARAWFPRGQ